MQKNQKLDCETIENAKEMARLTNSSIPKTITKALLYYKQSKDYAKEVLLLKRD